MAVTVDFASTVAEDSFLNVPTVFQFFLYILGSVVMEKNFGRTYDKDVFVSGQFTSGSTDFPKI